MVDVSGTELQKGDKVAVQYSQLFRIGIITGFTQKKVIVGFDFTSSEEDNMDALEEVKLNPWKLAKVCNQNIKLKDYFNYIKA